jgi:glyoxylase-like metal-dependent hydrolase (beta-lactamase superfamily II)
MKKLTVVIAAAFALSATSALAETALKYEVLYGTPFNNVTSTIIYGEKDAVLIDGGLFLSDGHRIAARLLDLKRNLTTAYITHSDADHYFGLSIVKSAFPDARIVALPTVATRIVEGEQATLAQWHGMMGG